MTETDTPEDVEVVVKAKIKPMVIRPIQITMAADPHINPAMAIPLPSREGSFLMRFREMAPITMAGIEQMMTKKLTIPRTSAATARPSVLRTGAAGTSG
jgi:hypothetical protein